MEAISVPRPPRLVPITSSRTLSVNPESKRALGTLLITWLVITAVNTSFPFTTSVSIWQNQGIRFIFPMKIKNPMNVNSRA